MPAEQRAAGRALPAVLVETNVFRQLEEPLRAAGFNVLKAGSAIYFPATGQQGRFHEQSSAVAGGAGLL